MPMLEFHTLIVRNFKVLCINLGLLSHVSGAENSSVAVIPACGRVTTFTSLTKIGRGASILAGAAAGIAIWATFAVVRHGLPGWLRFILAGGLFLFGPGAALTWRALPDVALSHRVVLAFGFGLWAAPLLAHVLSIAGLLHLYPYIAAACSGAVLGRSSGTSASSSRASLLAPAVLAIVALAIGYAAYANRVAELPDRTIYYGEYDTFDIMYYAAISSELTHTIPPEAPFHAGRALNHAFYPQLPVALLRLYADVPVLDTYFRYLWPAYFALTALMCYVFVESIASRGVAFLSALLLIIGSDLSYLAVWFYPTLSKRWDYVTWSANFLSPSAETLLFNNWTPTLAVLFAGMYALAAHERDPRRLWILAAGGSFAITAQFKPFAFASLAAALAAATVVSWRDRPAFRRFLSVGVVAAVMSAPYVYRIVTLADDAQATAVVDFFTLPRTLLRRLNLERPWLEWAASLGLSGTLQIVFVGLLGMVLFLIGGLGFRLAGLPGVVRILWRPCQQRPVWRMLAWTIVAAVVPPFVISIAPNSYETMHFHQLTLFLLPIFVARAVMSSPSNARRVAAAALIIAVSLPSTVHYVHRKWRDGERPHTEFLAQEARVAELLRQYDPDRTVFLHNQPRRASLVAVVSERRSVLAWGGYVRNSRVRERDINRFYRSADSTDAEALTVLHTYQPTHVVAYPATDRIHPAVLGRLRVVFRSPDVVLYEVPDALRTPP